jgi:hypothetical protein
MCKKLFTKPQMDSMVALWTRDDLGLSPTDYGRKIQVYKRLSKVWSHPQLRFLHHDKRDIQWDQTNTVLLDDSPEKAASEPFNLIEIDTYDGRPSADAWALLQVEDYLETLRMQANVSAYIREHPFKCVSGRRTTTTSTEASSSFEGVEEVTEEDREIV